MTEGGADSGKKKAKYDVWVKGEIYGIKDMKYIFLWISFIRICYYHKWKERVRFVFVNYKKWLF